MKKVLLLGANGQLGNDIQKIFINANVELVALTRKDFDVENSEVAFFETYKDIDYIINTISYHNTDECEEQQDKAFKVNSSFVYELAKFSKKNDIVLFHISTDYVFDGKKQNPYIEQDTPSPLNIYGLSKTAGELAIKQYAEKYFIFRVSSLFGEVGASGKGGNFVETMIRLAKNEVPLKIIADQYMAPTHTLDIAKALLAFIEKNIEKYGIYHCCNNGQCSWFDFTKKIFELMDLNYPLGKTTYAQYKTKAIRPQYSVLDNQKLNAIYTMPTWENALKEYLTIKKYI